MRAITWFIFNLGLLILAGCNPGGESSGPIKINTSGIFNPVSLSYREVEIQPVHDLGEYLLGSPKKVFAFKLRNNSLYHISRVTLTLEGFSSYGFKFNKDQNGVSAYPGYMGTCADTLAPGGICTIYLQFETAIKGQYQQDITFHYKNLVEEQTRPLKLIILAGNAASLIFDGDITNYSFGQKVGLSQTPVVEKEEKLTFSKTINVTNVGDLGARDIKLSLTQGCASTGLNGECPEGQNDAYSYTTNCPSLLLNGQSCQAFVKFSPKNYDEDIQNPDPALSEIRFNSNLKYAYLNSLETINNKAAINAAFTSVSTRIEANFATSIDSLPFEGEIVVGNRMTKPVRVVNKGFREGNLHKLVVQQNGSIVGHCVRESSSLFMNCYADTSLTIPLSLASFPFYFRDRDSCFGTLSLNDGASVGVDEGCQLDVIFQPSVSYKTDGQKSFSLVAEFDTRWKGTENINSNYLFESSGTYLAAARLIPNTASFDGKSFSFNWLHPLNEIGSIDLGRLGMMSENTFTRKALTVSFKNVGGVVANSIAATDGWGITIPKREENPSGVHLKPAGGDNKPHYSGALISTSNCNQIGITSSCSVSMNFAPISKGAIGTTRSYAFDQNNLIDPSLSYKTVFMNYRDGSAFSDVNRTDTPDIGMASAQIQIKLNLVARGVLGDLVNRLSDSTVYPYSQTTKTYVLLSNIGTDTIRYIGYKGLTAFNARSGISVVDSDLATVRSQNPSISGVLKDCKGIVDFNYLASDNCATVESKISSAPLGSLAPDESCVLTYQHTPTVYDLLGVPGHPLQRPLYRGFNNTIYSWPYNGSNGNFHALFDYYNNDLNAPGDSGQLSPCVGGLESSTDVNGQTKHAPALMIHPHSPYPNASAVLYHGNKLLPALIDGDSVLVRSATAVSASWLFSPYNLSDVPTTGEIDARVVTAIKSKNHFPAQVTVPVDLNDYDFVIHLGTFPTLKTVKTGFHLSSMLTGLPGVWKGSSTSTVLRPGSSAPTGQFVYGPAVPLDKPILGTQIVFPATTFEKISIDFTADKQGLYASQFIYEYTNGERPGTPGNPTVTQKILIIAEAIEEAPVLEVSVAKYKVETNGTSAPILTPSNAAGFLPSDYISYTSSSGDARPDDSISLEAVKVPLPTNTDFFVRTQVRIKNKSLSYPMTELKLLPKNTTASTVVTSLNFGNEIKFCFGSTSETLCQGSCGETLAPGASCFFEVYYQPKENQLTKEITVQANYKIQANQHFSENIVFSFMPKDPATLIAQGKVKSVILVNDGNISSYPMDFGIDQEITSDRMTIAFDTETGALSKRITVKNTSLTRASFLKSYQQYKNISNINAYPDDSEYTYFKDGVSYTQIYQKNYKNNPSDPHIKVFANKTCLLGEDSSELDALPLFKKGFNSASPTDSPCYLAVFLIASTHYMNIELAAGNKNHMDPNHVRLPFYNNDRSAFGNFIIHFTGKLKPPSSMGSPDNLSAYTGVEATSDGVVKYSWHEMLPKNPSLGSIVKYRVFYTTNQSILNNIYTANVSYTDFTVNQAVNGVFRITQSGFTPGKFYYFRVVPIRYFAEYKPTETFVGVGSSFFNLTTPGQYISETNVPKLSVVIPPASMFYDHNAQLLIYKDIALDEFLTVNEARSVCSSMTKLRLSKSNESIDYVNRMITPTAWESILSHPEGTSYSPITYYSLWLDGPQLNIHQELSAYPGYNPSEDMAYMEENEIFYQKNNQCQPNCPGNKVVGSVFRNPEHGNYVSYISEGLAFGSVRCHVDLNRP